MADLLIDGNPVTLAPGFEETTEPTHALDERQSGKMGSATRGPRKEARVWRGQTLFETYADGVAIQALIQAPGYVDIGGDLPGATVRCAGRVTRELRATSDQWVLDLELTERLSARGGTELQILTQGVNGGWYATDDPSATPDGYMEASGGGYRANTALSSGLPVLRQNGGYVVEV